MASRASSKTLTPNAPKIQVGEKIARFFASHELPPGLGDQWIQGKVAASKLVLKKGSKNIQQPWWTLTFDAPCLKLLCCNSEEVEEMKQQYYMLRQKMAALEQQVGVEVTVLWTPGRQRPVIVGLGWRVTNLRGAKIPTSSTGICASFSMWL